MFPTTLREISYPNLFSVYGEINGFRFILGNGTHYVSVQEIGEQYAFKYKRYGLRVYISDKADNTIIHGAWEELRAMIENHPELAT